MIPVELFRIVISENSDQQLIWLRERAGGRCFPIIIGFFEAQAIDRNVKNIKTPRPLTHDLVATAISRLGGTLDRVEIHDLRDNTFFARLVVVQDGREVVIDSRPSDAVAVATQTGRRILVAEQVLEEVGTPLPQSTP